MLLSQKDLESLCERAIKASHLAGDIIKEALPAEKTQHKKTEGSSLASQVVTEIDFKSQSIILNELEASIKQFDLGLLTEESQDDKSRLIKDYFWCIDPLDGTLPFTEQTNGFAVSTALVQKNGLPVIGVVFDPLTNTTYSAIKSKGVKKNGIPLALPSANKHFTLISDRSFYNSPAYTLLYNKISKEYPNINTISHGGAVMNAIWTLENLPALYLKLPKKEQGGGSIWDYAATNCIFNELPFIATDIKKQPLQLNKKDTTFMNESGVFYCSSKEPFDLLDKLLKQ